MCESAFDKLCFDETQRDRKWVVCGGDSSLGGLSGSPCSSFKSLKHDRSCSFRSHPLSLFPLCPLVFQYPQQRLRPERKATSLHLCWQLNISHRYYSSLLVNRDVLVFCLYCILLFLAHLLCVCSSHVFTAVWKVLAVSESTITVNTWTTDFPPQPYPLFVPSWISLCVCVSECVRLCSIIFREEMCEHPANTHTNTLLQGFTVRSDKLYNQQWYWLVIGEEMSCQNVLMAEISKESLTSLSNIEK